MAVLRRIDPNEASGTTREHLERLEATLGRVPSMIHLMANSPAILDTYLHFNHAFDHAKLSPKARALLTVRIAELNGCDYTLSLGTALAKRQGVPDAELQAARAGGATDVKTTRVLQFATDVVQRRGRVPLAEVESLRRAGFSDEEIVEIVAAVALNVFRNYFNLVAGTELDSPPVTAHQPTQLVERG